MSVYNLPSFRLGLLTAFVFCFPLQASAQWKTIHPFPTGADLQAVDFRDGRRGLVAGASGTLLSTEDGGHGWSARYSGTRATLQSVAYASDVSAFAVGDSGVILGSRDGGAQWYRQARGLVKANLRAVHFQSSEVGCAAGDSGIILLTRDGGQTWNRVRSGTTENLLGIRFANDSFGVAVGAKGTWLSTRDMGQTWALQSNFTQSDLVAVDFSRLDSGFIASADGAIFQGDAQGTSWKQNGAAGGSFTVTGVSVQGPRVYATALGGRFAIGNVLISSWFTDVVAGPALNGLSFVGRDTGFVVGSQGLILGTSDGGRHWDTLGTGPAEASVNRLMDIRSFHIIDDDHAMALGGSSLLETKDGGRGWEIRTPQVPISIEGSHFPDATTGYGVGQFGRIAKTEDGGKIWKELSVTVGHHYFAVHFFSRDIGLVAGTADAGGVLGYQGLILRTRDAGASWDTVLRAPRSIIRSLSFSGSSNGIAVGERREISGSSPAYFTRDGGATWEQGETGNGRPLYSVHLLDTGLGFACGAYETILKTRNWGRNWIQVRPKFLEESPSAPILYAIHALGPDNIIAVGSGGLALISRDGGTTWESMSTGTNQEMRTLAVRPGGRIYAAGANSTILEYVPEIAGNISRSANKSGSRPLTFLRKGPTILFKHPGRASLLFDARGALRTVRR